MILALPYLPGATDYRALAADMRKRGPLAGHTLRVFSKAEDADAAFDFGQDLADLFDKTTAQGVDIAPDGGKFAAANALFRAAATFLHGQPTPKGEPDAAVLLYYDPAYRPTKVGWLKEIQSAYFFAGAPAVFGNPVTLPDGETRVFMGPLVLSRAFTIRSALINFLLDTVHWRMFLRSEMLVDYADTPLVGVGSEAVLQQVSATPTTKKK